MPYISIQTNQSFDASESEQILKKISHGTAEILSKPESYVMVALQSDIPMSFAGNTEPTAYIQLKSLGLPQSSTGDFSQAFCSLVNAEMNINTDRIYIEFAGPDRHMWGWNKSTF